MSAQWAEQGNSCSKIECFGKNLNKKQSKVLFNGKYLKTFT